MFYSNFKACMSGFGAVFERKVGESVWRVSKLVWSVVVLVQPSSVLLSACF